MTVSGSPAQRTALAWQRTSLAAAVTAIVVARYALTDDNLPAGAAAVLLGAMTLVCCLARMPGRDHEPAVGLASLLLAASAACGVAALLT